MLGFYTLVGVGIELGDNAVLQRCMIPSITLLMFFLTPTTPKLRTADVERTRQLMTMPNYRTKKDLEKKREELSLTTANKGPFTFEVRKNLGFLYPLPPCHCPTHATYQYYCLLLSQPSLKPTADVICEWSLSLGKNFSSRFHLRGGLWQSCKVIPFTR